MIEKTKIEDLSYEQLLENDIALRIYLKDIDKSISELQKKKELALVESMRTRLRIEKISFEMNKKRKLNLD